MLLVHIPHVCRGHTRSYGSTQQAGEMDLSKSIDRVNFIYYRPNQFFDIINKKSFIAIPW